MQVLCSTMTAPHDNTVPQEGAVAAYWSEYCRAASLPEATPYQAWHFGDTPALAHELAQLVLYGAKRATASLVWSNEAVPHAAPVPDGYSVITHFDGKPCAVIRTTSLQTWPLAAVDAQFAWDAGEGDRTLADWLDGHRRYFARECAQLGRTFSDDAPVALERFELLYPFDRALAAPDGPRIVPGYLPGAIGAVASLHAGYYGPAHGFGAYFEAKVARGFADFVERFDPARDGLWLVVDAGRIGGSIVIDGSESTSRARQLAHLRWFVLGERLRGRGLGKRLLDAAMEFCRRAGFRLVYLNTFAGLHTARALYERAGFRLVAEVDGETWGRTMREQRFEWTP